MSDHRRYSQSVPPNPQRKRARSIEDLHSTSDERVEMDPHAALDEAVEELFAEIERVDPSRKLRLEVEGAEDMENEVKEARGTADLDSKTKTSIFTEYGQAMKEQMEKHPERFRELERSGDLGGHKQHAYVALAFHNMLDRYRQLDAKVRRLTEELDIPLDHSDKVDIFADFSHRQRFVHAVKGVLPRRSRNRAASSSAQTDATSSKTGRDHTEREMGVAAPMGFRAARMYYGVPYGRQGAF
ncbi:hypothetical protein JCM10213_003562 [Rhodosporidiobolus nylandii]